MIENSQATNEAQVRLLLDEWINALRVKDSDRFMSLYSPDIVVFDAPPPLQRVGSKAYGKHFPEWFDSFRGPITFETRGLSIAVGADVAFSHSLIRTSGTMKSGKEIDRWLRWTLCLRKISGKWLITHEHVSRCPSIWSPATWSRTCNRNAQAIIVHGDSQRERSSKHESSRARDSAGRFRFPSATRNDAAAIELPFPSRRHLVPDARWTRVPGRRWRQDNAKSESKTTLGYGSFFFHKSSIAAIVGTRPRFRPFLTYTSIVTSDRALEFFPCASQAVWDDARYVKCRSTTSARMAVPRLSVSGAAPANVSRRKDPGASAGNQCCPGLTTTLARAARAATFTSETPSGSRIQR